MSRRVKITSAAIAALLAATIVGIVGYERGSAAQQERSVSYDLSPASQAPVVRDTHTAREVVAVHAQAARQRLLVAPSTVIKLAETRNGCTLTHEFIPIAVCRAATAFPELGLRGTVTFIGSANEDVANQTLTFKLES